MNEILEETILEKKLLESLILQFHSKLLEESKQLGERSSEGIEARYWLTKFREHFKIETQTHGKI